MLVRSPEVMRILHGFVSSQDLLQLCSASLLQVFLFPLVNAAASPSSLNHPLLSPSEGPLASFHLLPELLTAKPHSGQPIRASQFILGQPVRARQLTQDQPIQVDVLQSLGIP